MTNMRLITALFQTTADGILITGPDRVIQYVNPAFSGITGYTANEVLGKDPRCLKSGKHDTQFYANLWKSIAVNGYWRGEIYDRNKKGEIYKVWTTISAIHNGNKEITNYLGTFSEFPQRQRNLEQARYQAAGYDMLTGLPKRSLFRDRLHTTHAIAKRHANRFALLILKLDSFKPVNDIFGYATGDELLRETADRLRKRVREVDTVARFGGDVFAVIVSDVNEIQDIFHIARNILKWLQVPFSLGEHTVTVSACIGVAVYPDDSIDIDHLLKQASMAGRRARTLGKGRLCFHNRQWENMLDI
ncbi:MAG: diguanylate cyclase [Gammaproteobacteria bacterium]|nr:diguanylate cyclase [Gammaproteobacteria bacterium]